MKIFSFIFIFIVYLFLFLPMFVLVTLSFNSAPRGSTWEGFTLDWYAKLFEDQAIIDALLSSLEIALYATLLSAIMGLGVGLVCTRRVGVEQKLMTKIAHLPIVFPEIVQGLSLLCFFVLLSIPLGFFSVVIAHTAFGTAYVASLIRARLANIDTLIEEAAADLGASPSRIFLQILLPQLWPAILSGMLMVFTLSFDDFIISFFTSGAGVTTLPLKIYSMLKFGVSPEVNALSALILFTSLLLVCLAFWSQNRKTEA